MARPQKATVDYFPMDCQLDDEIQAIENIYGNNGYVVWFKLLQKLGRTENHILDLRSNTSWKLFYSLFRIEEELLIKILDTLAELNRIDPDLWAQKIIYSENFVKRVSDAYRNRKNVILTKHEVLLRLGISDVSYLQVQDVSNVRNSISDVRNPQTKLNKTKLNKNIFIKEEKTKLDPSINPIIQKFSEEYQKQFNSRLYLNYEQKMKLIEISSDITDFNEKIPELLEKFKNIEFTFQNGETKRPGLTWLIDKGNWTGVLNGDFDKPKGAEYVYNPNL